MKTPPKTAPTPDDLDPGAKLRPGVEACSMDDFLNDGGPENGHALAELKIGREETPVYFCSRQIEKVPLHYEQHESLRGFFRCTGDDCLYCRFKKLPTLTYLMAVFSLHDGDIRVLRVPAASPGRQDAQSLGTQIKNLLRTGGATQVVYLTRDGASNRVSIRTQPIKAEAMGNLAAIKDFEVARAAGEIVLADTFRTYDAGELAQVPWVQARLQAEMLLSGGATGANATDA